MPNAQREHFSAWHPRVIPQLFTQITQAKETLPRDLGGVFD